MTSTVPEPPAIPPKPDPDADARFAAYLADVAAHVDDPQWGEDHRAILNDDPQTQRALFDLVEAMKVAPASPPLSMLVMAVAAVVVNVALFMFRVRFVS